VRSSKERTTRPGAVNQSSPEPGECVGDRAAPEAQEPLNSASGPWPKPRPPPGTAAYWVGQLPAYHKPKLPKNQRDVYISNDRAQACANDPTCLRPSHLSKTKHSWKHTFSRAAQASSFGPVTAGPVRLELSDIEPYPLRAATLHEGERRRCQSRPTAAVHASRKGVLPGRD
jgi:hypothetical protein